MRWCPHWWRDTHCNPYGLITRQECRLCSVSRQVEKGEGLLNFVWLYSDGRIEKDERLFKYVGKPALRRKGGGGE